MLLEFKLTDYDVAIQHGSHYAMKTLPFLDSMLPYKNRELLIYP